VNNTGVFSTALGSQRGNTRGDEKRGVKKQPAGNQGGVIVQKMVKNQGSKRFDSNTVYSVENQKPQNLKQTAQFGPQMNLIKSHLPHHGQNPKIKSAEMR